MSGEPIFAYTAYSILCARNLCTVYGQFSSAHIIIFLHMQFRFGKVIIESLSSKPGRGHILR